MIKIAFPTDDGQTLSAHLGMARYFKVITLDSDRVSNTELREKPYHSADAHPDHSNEDPGNGTHPGRAGLQTIADCQVLIAGGMGQPAHQAALAQGLQVILTGEKIIQSALEAYQAGRLTSDPRRVHSHH
jgi:predicted Fe-Mo cluster-binding NifX family protein